MMKLLAVCIIAVFVTFATSGFVLAANGIDIYRATPTSVFQCLVANKIDFIITRAWHSYGAPDTNAPINLNNAKQAGIKHADIYMYPCPLGMNATQQMNAMLNMVGQGLEQFGQVWLDLEFLPSGKASCQWSSSDYDKNCKFLGELIEAGIQRGAKLGIYSSHYEWKRIFGNADACTDAALKYKLPLWYANYDNVQSFSDYNATKFGGWTQPAIKQYSDKNTVCNVPADSDWYPN